MKKKLSLLFTIYSILTFSQNLYLTKRDYSVSPTIHKLQKVNSNNGSILSTINFNTNFPNSYTSKSLTFNTQTNEIFGISDNIITKNNIVNSNESSFTLPLSTSVDYGGIIIVNNRLFVTKRDGTTTPTTHSINEVNPINGAIISSHIISSSIPTSYNRDLTFSNSTNEIYGLSGNIIYKYNILTGIETTLTLPIITSGEYNDIIIAENRLFVMKRDYSITPTTHTLLELNPSNVSILNSHILTTNLNNYDKIRSLTFLADTHEICGIIKNQTTFVDFKIIKYNFINNTESSFDLLSQTSNDYGEIISTITEQNLSLTEFNQENNHKIVKAYNLLGQEIQIETKNQIIIIELENGQKKKIFNY